MAGMGHVTDSAACLEDMVGDVDRGPFVSCVWCCRRVSGPFNGRVVCRFLLLEIDSHLFPVQLWGGAAKWTGIANVDVLGGL